MATFTLNDSMFKSLQQNVEKAKNTNTEKIQEEFQIEYIPIYDIYRNEKNFYEITDIELLAEDIEENGLNHNLVVRKTEQGYELISGERRYAAMTRLFEAGNKMYSKIPCKVIDVDDVDGEIILIQANARTRELTETDLLKQVERLTALYQIKKKRKEKVPGRIQELIAQDLKLSKTQVGRYERINKKLLPELKQIIEEGKLSISNASEFATLSKENQYVILDILKENNELNTTSGKELKEQLLKLEENRKSTAKEDSSTETIKKIKTEFTEQLDLATQLKKRLNQNIKSMRKISTQLETMNIEELDKKEELTQLASEIYNTVNNIYTMLKNTVTND